MITSTLPENQQLLVNQYIDLLNLLPHPEGGFYQETYRSTNQYQFEPAFEGLRNTSTAIYFLLVQNNFSAFHRIKSDETWHFYTGNALEVIELNEKGELKITTLGPDILNGQVFQYTVKANTWFASRVKQGGEFSLVGCNVSPGFDFNDFEMAKRHVLISEFPVHKQLIESLTR